MSRLTTLQIQQAKPKERAHKLMNGNGLFLLVMIKGSKYWRASYRYNKKQKTLALGVYPDVSLKMTFVR